MTESRGVGLKRRKEAAQPALFVLARPQAFITPPEIQSKTLFTHSAYGVRASRKSFSLSFSLTPSLPVCLSQRQCLIYMVFVEISALTDHFCLAETTEGRVVALCVTFLSVSLHLLLFRLSFPLRLSFLPKRNNVSMRHRFHSHTRNNKDVRE